MGPRWAAIIGLFSAGGMLLDPVLEALYRASPFWNVSGLIRWNDHPERTQAEVVAKLREAAALSRAGKSS